MSPNVEAAARFAALLRAYADSFYPERHLSDEAICAYFGELGEQPIEAIAQALSTHVRSVDRCGRFPKPGDLLRHLAQGGNSLAEDLWQDVQLQIRRTGRYGAPQFADPRTLAAVQAIGGWEAITNCASNEDLAERRRDFERALKRLAESAVKPSTPLAIG